MWGSIVTESNTLTNFNFGFSTYKSDILMHLSQWQYWWWFWFSLFWTLYFFIIIRLMNKRTMSFNPTLNTSIRGHGKWGDFLVALIPLSWCGNILVNSNFILRMIEWQNESSLFTIRVQGKQWYWVYKYDASAAMSILNAPKNIGHNRWVVTTKLDSYKADTYYQALDICTQLEFKGLYHKYLNNEDLSQKTLNKSYLNSIAEGTHNTSINTIKEQRYSHFRESQAIKLKNLFINRVYWRSKEIIRKTFENEQWKINPRERKLYIFLKTYMLYYLVEDEMPGNLDIDFKYFSKYRFIHRNDSVSLKKELYKVNKNKSKLSSNFYDFKEVDDLSNFAANVEQNRHYKSFIITKLPVNKYMAKTFSKKWFVNWYAYYLETKRIKTNWINKFWVKSAKAKKYGGKLVTVYNDRIYKEALRDLNTPKERTKPTRLALLRKWQAAKRSKQYYRSLLLKDGYTGVMRGTRIITSKHYIVNYDLFYTTRLFSAIFLDPGSITKKIPDNEMFWGFRQKKYKRVLKFIFKNKTKYNRKTLLPEKLEGTYVRTLKNSLITTIKKNFSGKISNKSAFNYQNSIKYNKHRSELVPVNLARRLLRTKRTLVLPAHVNITLISSSYDVVHSWFIPGLGLKIDCVPGRSTHHSFYIDNIGFYYGQCAEICGRYHHHMPIRLCALSFDHFLVWWHKKGLKRLNRFSLLSKNIGKKEFIHPITGSSIK